MYTQKRKQVLHGLFRTLALMLAALCASNATLAQERPVEWQGFINTLPGTANFVGDWKVNNRTVKVSATTAIKQQRAKAEVGAFVEIKGSAAAGADTVITATSIEVKYRAGAGVPVEIAGTVETLPSAAGRIGDWKISGKTIKVSTATRLAPENGQFAVGSQVRGSGLQQADGSINATMIVLLPTPPVDLPVLVGMIEKLPSTTGRIGDWTVAGRLVRVNDKTVINGTPAVGSLAAVVGTRQGDGSVLASKIDIRVLPPIPTVVTFKGVVETVPGTTGLIGDWKISGRTVTVNSRTALRPNAAAFKVGVNVEVYGSRVGDGPVTAAWIQFKTELEANPNYTRFYGFVKTLPATTGFIGEWNVDGKMVVVNATTKLVQDKGAAAVGAFVEVEGIKQTDGKIVAAEIEIQRASTLGFVRMTGVVETLPAAANRVGMWTVSKRVIHVSEKTKINQDKKPLAVGVSVDVAGNLRADGSIDATEISTKADPGTVLLSFVGTVNALPTTTNRIGEWKINNRSVFVTDKTTIKQEKGTIAVGSIVEVKGTVRTDGAIDATSIELKQATPSGGGVAQLVEFTGKIVTLPANAQNFVGEWKVDDKAVRVTGATRINREKGKIEVGATVKVKGVQIGNNPLDAASIEVVAATAAAADFEEHAPLASVSATSYNEAVTANSIIAAFGANLSATTIASRELPLPTKLNGVEVLVDGLPAGLFFVSPTQINYLVPEGVQPGVAQVTVEVNDNVVAQGALVIEGVAPGIFTADASGNGTPAGVALRVRGAEQVYESLVRYEDGRPVAVPIAQRSGESVVLVLYGSGWRNNGALEDVEVTIGETQARVLYAGAAPSFAGLDQLNILLPAGLPTGITTITVKVNDGDGGMPAANQVTVVMQ